MSGVIDRLEVTPLLERMSENHGIVSYPILLELRLGEDAWLRTEGTYTVLTSGHEYFNFGDVSDYLHDEEEIRSMEDIIRAEMKKDLKLPLRVLCEWTCDKCGHTVDRTNGLFEYVVYEETDRFQRECTITVSDGFHIVHQSCKYSPAFLERHGIQCIRSFELSRYHDLGAFVLAIYEEGFFVKEPAKLREIAKRFTIPYYETLRNRPARLNRSGLPVSQLYQRTTMRNIAFAEG